MRYLQGHPRMGYSGGGRGFMMIPMALMCLLFLIVFAYVVYKVVKHLQAHKLGHVHGQSSKTQDATASVDITVKALEILNERFAKGEILEEEYKSKKELILK